MLWTVSGTRALSGAPLTFPSIDIATSPWSAAPIRHKGRSKFRKHPRPPLGLKHQGEQRWMLEGESDVSERRFGQSLVKILAASFCPLSHDRTQSFKAHDCQSIDEILFGGKMPLR